MGQDPYFDRAEISNSDLSTLKKYWQPVPQVVDLEAAYRFGTLVDALITEPDKVDVYKRKVMDYVYSDEEMKVGQAMLQAFWRDPFCSRLAQQASMQKVSIKPRFAVSKGSFRFHLPMRGKWDLFVENMDMSGEIKSTACTTQKQFEESISYFEYDRQAALYMDFEQRCNHMIIGISKKNYNIFKVPVTRGSHWYKRGLSLYQDLAFKWWCLFGNFDVPTRQAA